MLLRLFRVLLACIFPSRCLLSFWCYHSPVRAGCLRVCPPQLKMVYSDYVKQRILFYRRLGKSFVHITRCLLHETKTNQVRSTASRDIRTSFVAKFAHVSVIRRCFLSVPSVYVLYPLSKIPVRVYVLHPYIIERTPVVR